MINFRTESIHMTHMIGVITPKTCGPKVLAPCWKLLYNIQKLVLIRYFWYGKFVFVFLTTNKKDTPKISLRLSKYSSRLKKKSHVWFLPGIPNHCLRTFALLQLLQMRSKLLQIIDHNFYIEPA